jgi:hypothetical protein
VLITDPEDEQSGQDTRELYDRRPGPKSLLLTIEEGANRHCEPLACALRDTRNLRLARRLSLMTERLAATECGNAKIGPRVATSPGSDEQRLSSDSMRSASLTIGLGSSPSPVLLIPHSCSLTGGKGLIATT